VCRAPPALIDTNQHVGAAALHAVLQELLHYVPWPSDVLEDYAPVAAEALGVTPAAAAVGIGRGGASSRGRGPVLRMGLAEGTPHSILPDHLVRDCAVFKMLCCCFGRNVIKRGQIR
jgi:hypothetical protein